MKIDKEIIDKVLDNAASPNEVRAVYDWFATDEGQEHLSQRLLEESKLMGKTAVLIPILLLGTAVTFLAERTGVFSKTQYAEITVPCGERIFDLLRWDAVKTIFGDGKQVKLHFYSDYLPETSSDKFKTVPGLKKYPTEHILFPIPQYEMDQNKSIIENNPGY